MSTPLILSIRMLQSSLILANVIDPQNWKGLIFVTKNAIRSAIGSMSCTYVYIYIYKLLQYGLKHVMVITLMLLVRCKHASIRTCTVCGSVVWGYMSLGLPFLSKEFPKVKTTRHRLKLCNLEGKFSLKEISFTLIIWILECERHWFREIWKGTWKVGILFHQEILLYSSVHWSPGPWA